MHTVRSCNLLTHHSDLGVHSFCGIITNTLFGSLEFEVKEERGETTESWDYDEASCIDLYSNSDYMWRIKNVLNNEASANQNRILFLIRVLAALSKKKRQREIEANRDAIMLWHKVPSLLILPLFSPSPTCKFQTILKVLICGFKKSSGPLILNAKIG